MKKIEIAEKIASIFPFVYLLRNHQNLAHFFQIASDYQRAKKGLCFLKNKTQDYSNKKILIVSLTHFLYQVKTEAMLGKALQLAGAEIVVLTWKHFFWPRKYFKLFGINNFIYFEDYLKQFDKFDCKKDLRNFPLNNLTFQKVKGWQFKQCRLGQQVLSRMARRMHRTPDFSNKQDSYQLEYYLKNQIKSIYAAEKMIKNINPDCVLFNEANDHAYGAIFDLSFLHRKDIVQFVQPLRDDSLIFKRFNSESKGLHPNSLSKSTFDRIKEIEWTKKHEDFLQEEFGNRYGGKWFLSKRNQLEAVNKSKDEIIGKLELDTNKRTAIIFSHVLWDANLFYGDDLFQDYEDWFVETLKAACSNKNLNWIIKLHPANIWKRNRDNLTGELREIMVIREKIGKLSSHVKILLPDTDISTLSLFNFVDYGITVRGTTGMELPCFGKPVFTAGTGRYSGLGFTVDSVSKDEYLKNLSHIHEFPLLTEKQTLWAKKHAYTAFILRPWIMNSFRAEFNYKNKGTHPLDHNLYPVVSNLNELKKADDLKEFSNWVLNSKDSDYLNRNF